ncbi:MAG: tyrosine-type recombinase/integrase [Flavobacteriales bacterium]|nr:tyrosine-type recombinase/integrase [Flavobacteriales bacterium]MCB9448988.1 tyrosine-type recombinase/integrase [Flavobacteriales bacterium]
MESSEKLTLYFYPNGRKRNQASNLEPIYCRISIAGQKPKEFSIGKLILREHWNRKRQMASHPNGDTGSIRLINEKIATIRNKIMKIFEELLEENRPISPTTIKNILTEKGQVKRTYLEAFDALLADYLVKVNTRQCVRATYQKYATIRIQVGEFFRTKLQVDDLPLKRFVPQHVKELANYFLLGGGGFAPKGANTTAKYISHCQSVFMYAMDLGWATSNPFAGIRIKKQPVNTVYLNEDELDVLRKVRVHTERLERIRDIFVFCCFTGLAYADVKKLTYDDISRDMDGDYCILDRRQKTDIPYNIPLAPPAVEIIDRYREYQSIRGIDNVLPVPANANYNAYLKEIRDLCGFTKELTTHVARHTAATLMLSNGVAMEVVQRVLGHSEIRTTQHYARLMPHRIKQSMKELMQKYATRTHDHGMQETQIPSTLVKKNKAL